MASGSIRRSYTLTCASSLLLLLGTAGTASAALATPPAQSTRTVLPMASDPGKILELVNEARKAAGCQPLAVDPKLTAAAQEYANDSTTNHTGSDGSSIQDRLKKAGATFNASAENIAWGSVDEKKHVDGWLASAVHSGNIKNCSYTKTGVAVSGDRIVQVFTD
ncbi:CAP domain-containing protein (plasmid) [Streptomyces goshikiensis]|uniref:CAP domain-containing protein n=1 Tax=Streptomyces goshikiensis TaxID=1942 RepID=A0ABZ1RXR1_9ACTN|nr:CAP domain-containing protein [Streptomyces goshikiensis]